MKSLLLMGGKDVVGKKKQEDETDDSHDSETKDKAHTFRKRRLSLDNLRQAAQKGHDEKDPAQEEGDDDDDPFSFFTEPPPSGALKDEDENSIPPPPTSPSTEEKDTAHAEDDEKAQSFRKRRLSLTLAIHENGDGDANDDASASVTAVEPPPPSRRRLDDSERLSSPEAPPKLPPKPQALLNRLPSMTFHASDLLAHKPTPTSSSHNHVLYQQKNAPPQRPTLDTLIPPQDMPPWSQSAQQQLQKEQQQKQLQQNGKHHSNSLPFPKHVVGTFSCHGVEPIYDKYRYEEDPVDNDNNEGEDEEGADGTSHRSVKATHEKPTTAAKINQDRGGVSFPYGNSARTALFAVYDGHGQGGELVSQFALHEVQRRLEHHETFISNITKAFIDTFVQVNADLATEPYIEPLYAGTTACVGLLRESQLICANVGDSRAVCARRCEGNGTNTVGNTASTSRSVGGNDPGSQDRVVVPQFQAIPLTHDQNPDWEPEMTRIEQMGGFVSPPPEPGLSARVWLDPDWTQIGLAMARSLGDYAVKKIGVIAEPIVTIHDIQAEDEFVIFATDGVWEFISSQEAVDLVGGHLAHHNDATKACQALMELAAERWHEEEGDYRDDITALVVRLPLLWKRPTSTAATATATATAT